MAEDLRFPPGEPASWLCVGDWTLDAEGDRLLRDDEVVKLEPRLTRLLLCLADPPGRVVPVAELLQSVWSDVVVTPESAYQAVAALRRAFGDDGRHPTYIANVPRKGYRMVAAVRPASPVPRAATPALATVAALDTAQEGTRRPGKAPSGDTKAPTRSLRPAQLHRPALVWTAALTVLVGLPLALRAWLGTPGGGEVFTTTGPSPVSAHATPVASGGAAVVPQHTLLWVDDKPENNHREREALEAFGMSFVLARSTQEALAHLAARRFDLVISDQRRPGDDSAGFSLLAHLRLKYGDRPPFVLYTSDCKPAEAVEARLLGAQACTSQISDLMHSVLVSLESRP